MTLRLTEGIKEKAGKNKKIPEAYQEPILLALLMYPELKDVRIEFKLVKSGPVPYYTRPSKGSWLKSRPKRLYEVFILEQAEEPENRALFKNLTKDEQIAVIAHELVHVIQFHSCSMAGLLKIMVMYPLPFFKRKLERGADRGAIEHGFGDNLYQHAVYLRSIPGYLKKRPDLNKYYLKPDEILKCMRTLEIAPGYTK